MSTKKITGIKVVSVKYGDGGGYKTDLIHARISWRPVNMSAKKFLYTVSWTPENCEDKSKKLRAKVRVSWRVFGQSRRLNAVVSYTRDVVSDRRRLRPDLLTDLYRCFRCRFSIYFHWTRGASTRLWSRPRTMDRDTWVLLFLLRHSRCCNVGVVHIKVTIFGRSTNRRTCWTKRPLEITAENSACTTTAFDYPSSPFIGPYTGNSPNRKCATYI